MSSPEEQAQQLMKIPGHIEEATLESVYNSLSPVASESLLGQWKGGSFDTGHPSHQTLADFKWAGKDFKSLDDVNPIMVYDKDGNRTWLEEYGHARLREVKFRGTVTAAMIYDKFPIIDYFRAVTPDIVLGAMDNKMVPNDGTYYFYLMRM
ncbi:hypothetical protein P170DRAFT_410112 [Aspergillus steynii IBT 23096]|uniref:GXWXG domain-containing protein n=1 Tax=Aspergillus steynii IBT 23096 TaxID=1392250 RepID=A0A2I2G4H6_9EURO|nr:uncharacterized protein P170DRAFT_410112 [Aspergillus steynii IBT 23096]PLB47790.1 hypothetical protein P170DRAFT_410112 [Aspergillus steynii IBT 23096]